MRRRGPGVALPLLVAGGTVLGACRASRPAEPQPQPRAQVAPITPDAAIAPPLASPDAGIVEAAPDPGDDREADDDPLADLGVTLDAQPFTYLRRRTATVAMSVFWNELAPAPFNDTTVEVSALALPGGPSLVCAGDELCWGIDGEMTFLHIPDDDLLTAAPYLSMVAVMPDGGRVDLTMSTWDATEHDATATPARQVDTFAPVDAPAWALPWVEWLGGLPGVGIVSGARPVAHVFVSDGERGVLCVSQDGRYRCGEPIASGEGQGDVRYAPGQLDFGPAIIAVDRNSRLESEDACETAQATLLFDAGQAELPWIATLPSAGYSRTRLRRRDPEATFPLLDVYLGWEIVAARRARALDPGCFTIRRSSSSRAKRFVHDPEGDEGIGTRKARLPRLPRVKAVPRDATPHLLSIAADFAGTWSVSAGGGLTRRAKCRPR